MFRNESSGINIFWINIQQVFESSCPNNLKIYNIFRTKTNKQVIVFNRSNSIKTKKKYKQYRNKEKHNNRFMFYILMSIVNSIFEFTSFC